MLRAGTLEWRSVDGIPANSVRHGLGPAPFNQWMEYEMRPPPSGVDRSSPVPIHFQVRKLLEHQIETGRWLQGAALPSELELGEYYGVSRATVRQALHSLEQQGLITKKKGRGSFVAETVSGSWLFQSVGGLFDDELSPAGPDDRVGGSPGCHRTVARLGRSHAAAEQRRDGSDAGEAASRRPQANPLRR